MAIDVRLRQATSLRPAIVRLDDVELRGLLAGLSDLEAEREDAEITRSLTFHPNDPFRDAADRSDGCSAMLSWAGRGCRGELPVAVQMPAPGEPMVLRATTTARRRQDRQASRVSVELPVHLWWDTGRLEQLTSVTANISATGLAVHIPNPSSPTGIDLPRPGGELAVAVELPGRTIACTASIVSFTKVATRSLARMRIERCRRDDIRRLAQFVIMTEARRA